MVYLSEIDITNDNKTAFGEVAVAEKTTAFHLHFMYNINTEHVKTLTVSTGTVTQSNNKAVLGTGANASSYATLTSRRRISYQGGVGVECVFSARWPQNPAAAGCFSIAGIGDLNGSYSMYDGYFIGYDYTSAGSSNSWCVFRARGGSITTVLRANFNGDTIDGNGSSGFNMNPVNLNLFSIVFPWVGVGNIIFKVMDPVTTKWIIYHVIQYPNTSTNPSSFNPSFTFCSSTYNFNVPANFTIEHSCVGCFYQGKEWGTVGLCFNQSNTKNITTETNILTIRNDPTVFGGTSNRTVVLLKTLSFATDGTKPVIFRVYINTTLGGVPAYTNINANTSVCSYDTAGTTITGGRKVCTFVLGKADNITEDINDLHINIYPSDIVTISAQSSAANDAFCSIIFLEDT